MMLASRVIKINLKIIISLCSSKSKTHSVVVFSIKNAVLLTFRFRMEPHILNKIINVTTMKKVENRWLKVLHLTVQITEVPSWSRFESCSLFNRTFFFLFFKSNTFLIIFSAHEVVIFLHEEEKKSFVIILFYCKIIDRPTDTVKQVGLEQKWWWWCWKSFIQYFQSMIRYVC